MERSLKQTAIQYSHDAYHNIIIVIVILYNGEFPRYSITITITLKENTVAGETHLGKRLVQRHFVLQMSLVVVQVRLHVVPHVTKPIKLVHVFCKLEIWRLLCIFLKSVKLLT